jgi:hypothetical protein
VTSSLSQKVFELERQNAQLSHEKGAVEKQLEEAAQAASSQKEEAERSLHELRDAAEASRAELEEQIKAKVEELKLLGEQIHARAASLESELRAAVGEKEGLEDQAAEGKRELESVKAENGELRSKVSAAEEKCPKKRLGGSRLNWTRWRRPRMQPPRRLTTRRQKPSRSWMALSEKWNKSRPARIWCRMKMISLQVQTRNITCLKLRLRGSRQNWVH